MKIAFTILIVSFVQFSFGQLGSGDLDVIDSLIAHTPEIQLCKKDGKEDLRFINRAPEKYSSYKDTFLKQMTDAITFPPKSNFTCQISVEVNCEGKAGNYRFAIEPRAFTQADFENFKQLIALVQKLRDYTFTPAVYLGEKVNSKTRFRIRLQHGRLLIQ
jgi:hypothetical protein